MCAIREGVRGEIVLFNQHLQLSRQSIAVSSSARAVTVESVLLTALGVCCDCSDSSSPESSSGRISTVLLSPEVLG